MRALAQKEIYCNSSSALDGKTGAAAELREIAVRIRGHEQAGIKNAIAIGVELIKAKEILGHGDFGKWLEAQFGWTDRTARNFMMAAACFAAKSETVSVLPVKTIYQLAAPTFPISLREQAIKQLDAGSHPKEVIELVEVARARIKLERQERKLQRKGERRKAARREAVENRRRNAHEQHKQEWERRADEEKRAEEAIAALLLRDLKEDRLQELIAHLEKTWGWSSLGKHLSIAREGGDQS
jgi:Protein of unknown function (DUF3102)